MMANDKLQELKERIAGEMVFSGDVASSFKKWRNIFGIGQKKLAMELNVRVSTISDYENGRRKNPGINFIERYVNSLCNIDLVKSGNVLGSLIKSEDVYPFMSKDFKKILTTEKFFKIMHEHLYDVNMKKLTENLYGITYIDTNEIKQIDFSKYSLVYGRTNKRILYFTKTTDMDIIDYTLRLLKHITGQLPLVVLIQDLDPIQNVERYKSLGINLPLFLTSKTKEDVQELLTF